MDIAARHPSHAADAGAPARLGLAVVNAPVEVREQNRMTEDELNLWDRRKNGDDRALKELVMSYLPLVDLLAKRIARMAGWANWEDLRQDGVIGLIKAIEKFDPARGVLFKLFMKPYVHGAILDSSELTHDLKRRQQELYKQIKKAEDELMATLGRLPTIEEVIEKTGLTREQIINANDAMQLAFAAGLPDSEDILQPSRLPSQADTERTLMLEAALSGLKEREALVIIHYYLEDRSAEEIAQQLGLTASNVTKIRQRALGKLGKYLGAGKKGK